MVVALDKADCTCSDARSECLYKAGVTDENDVPCSETITVFVCQFCIQAAPLGLDKASWSAANTSKRTQFILLMSMRFWLHDASAWRTSIPLVINISMATFAWVRLHSCSAEAHAALLFI